MAKWVNAVIPMLVCREAEAEIQFCKAAFGAVELHRRPGADGSVIHPTLKIADHLVMIHSKGGHLKSHAEGPDGCSPVVICVYLEGVDKVIEQAVKAGASILLPVEDAFWGDRVGRIVDPAGHVWNVSSRAKGSPLKCRS